ncbi:hypothetical protein P9578_03450 [Brevibacillus choshinensis]|uniref:hypothetical protein n=1 Tax=Brevibacillus choshinensis TaxID=54911 RepID=UPI002E2165CC|nr:hypothetical protein [Brevibacillus choshinensis]
MKVSVYYDYFEDKLSPLWCVITFRKDAINWNGNTVYIPIEVPFQCQSLEDFVSDSLGITVTLGDMTLNASKPGKFGIHLPPLRQRALESGYDYWEAEQLIFQVADLEELLHMNLFREVV